MTEKDLFWSKRLIHENLCMKRLALDTINWCIEHNNHGSRFSRMYPDLQTAKIETEKEIGRLTKQKEELEQKNP